MADIHTATQELDLQSIKEILDHKPEALNSQEEKDKNTPLNLAVNEVFWSKNPFSIEEGALRSRREAKSKEIVTYFLNYSHNQNNLNDARVEGVNVYLKNNQGFCALHLGVFTEDVSLCNELLTKYSKGTLSSLTDNTKKNPLHHAVEYNHFEIVKAISDADSNTLAVRDKAGFTPLHYAGYSTNQDYDLENTVNIMEYLSKKPTCIKHFESNDALRTFLKLDQAEPNLSPVVAIILGYYYQKGLLSSISDILNEYLLKLLRSYEFSRKQHTTICANKIRVAKMLAYILYSFKTYPNFNLDEKCITSETLQHIKTNLARYLHQLIYQEEITNHIINHSKLYQLDATAQVKDSVIGLWFCWSDQTNFYKSIQNRILDYVLPSRFSKLQKATFNVFFFSQNSRKPASKKNIDSQVTSFLDFFSYEKLTETTRSLQNRI